MFCSVCVVTLVASPSGWGEKNLTVYHSLAEKDLRDV